MMYERRRPLPDRSIADHGIVGNLDTTALIARDGAIDFLCWPHLDSPTIFAALLDAENRGEFTLTPDLADPRKTQLYIPETNVLLTQWRSTEGSAEVTDLMPHPDVPVGLHHCLIRQIRSTRGRIRFQMRCRPRFDYARLIPQVEARDGGVIFSADGIRALQLQSSEALTAECGQACATFELSAGNSAFFILRDAGPERPSREDVDTSIRNTIDAWQHWARRSTYKGRWRESVNRSILTLKLLTSRKHGSIAAAATFGLPEASGASRNWDYRATWIRDASFTVYAFMRLGYVEEAEQFRHWVGHRIRDAEPGGKLRIMYALDGSKANDESELEHFAGYGGARPVRIGNLANQQVQLDIYGELLDSVYLSNKYGAAISHEGWRHICFVVEHVIGHWRERDAGIWELRAEPREFLHSRLMCWVAIDRALRLAHKRSLPAPENWARERDRISDDIWTHFRHPVHGYFVQSRGSIHLDASALMMPLVRFVSATDPVWLCTLDAIRDQLADDGMMFRYRNDDGLLGGEGAFTTCTFWYAECLARAGRLDEAQLVMEKALAHANHLGLFSEELDAMGDPIGNFPQALTHLALISAAFFLDRRLAEPTGGVWQP